MVYQYTEFSKTGERYCRICGYEIGSDFKIGDNCLCCGSERDFSDVDLETARKYRQKWLDKGAPNKLINVIKPNPQAFPPDVYALVPEVWNDKARIEQMKNIPPEWV